MIEMMLKEGRYKPGFAGAITAAAATIGPIIPPSIPMVLYAIVSNTSVGYLFLGGIIPGLLMGLVLMIINTCDRGRRDTAREEPVPLREIRADTLNALPGAPDAGHPPVRNLRGRHDADRGGGRSGGLCLYWRPSSTGRCPAQSLCDLIGQHALHGLGRAGHRRRVDLQLRRREREHPRQDGRRLVGLDAPPLVILLASTCCSCCSAACSTPRRSSW